MHEVERRIESDGSAIDGGNGADFVLVLIQRRVFPMVIIGRGDNDLISDFPVGSIGQGNNGSAVIEMKALKSGLAEFAPGFAVSDISVDFDASAIGYVKDFNSWSGDARALASDEENFGLTEIRARFSSDPKSSLNDDLFSAQ